MKDPARLSRRERQIMDVLYARETATVNEVREALPDPPTDKAVRRMLEILEEKGHVKRRKRGREYRYRPTQSKRRAGERALRHVLDTFFGGAVDQAFAVHLGSKRSEIPEEELDRLSKLIEEARQKGR
jgi:predicted transcriptional regulator